MTAANAVDTAVASSCDHCGRTTGRLNHYPLSGNRNWLCTACVVMFSGEPACDFCERPTMGDYVRIDRSHSIANACGVCRDKWAANDDA